VKAAPQRSQRSWRSGKLRSAGAGIIVALLGIIGRQINHPVVTALRQPKLVRGLIGCTHAKHSPWPLAMAVVAIKD
jgi:hypothetical protein